MDEKFIRDIYYYKYYYLDFFETLKLDVKRKFNWTLKLIATIDRFLLNILNTSKEQVDSLKLELK
jgi:hypothetical protein